VSVEVPDSGRAGGVAGTPIAADSRMSRDEAPTQMLNSPPSSTHRRWMADQ